MESLDLLSSQFTSFEPHSHEFDAFVRKFDEELGSVQEDDDDDDDEMMSIEDDEYDDRDLIQLNKIEILKYQNASKSLWEDFRNVNPFLQLGNGDNANTVSSNFGMIYEDSCSGSQAFVPFYNDSIVAIIRQVDASQSGVSAYIVFNRFLTTRDYGVSDFANYDDGSMGDSDSQKAWNTSSSSTQKLQAWIKKQQESKEQKDYTFNVNSPLKHCIALMLHFTNERSILRLFDYVRENLSSLRTIHAGWMFAHEELTNRDVQLIGLKYDMPSNRAPGVDISYSERKANVAVRHRSIVDDDLVEDDEKSSDPAVGIVRNSPKKARSEPVLSAASEKITARNRKRPRAFAESSRPSLIQDKVSLLDKNLALLLLPHAFTRMQKPIQQLIVAYVQKDCISFFQLSNGLCEVLALARSKSAVSNALRVVHALSEHPQVQLKNIDAVRSFILSADKNTPSEREVREHISPRNQQQQPQSGPKQDDEQIFDHMDIELHDTPPQDVLFLAKSPLAKKRCFPNLELSSARDSSNCTSQKRDCHLQETVCVVHNIYPQTPGNSSGEYATPHSRIMANQRQMQAYNSIDTDRKKRTPPPVSDELHSQILSHENYHHSSSSDGDESKQVQIIHHHYHHYSFPPSNAIIYEDATNLSTKRRSFW
eukprot:CAMPEP_0117441868 /NCGR_PEP_ID=MMETSP0759-20121206/3856_1 /TAXON_ID=63605 /ORGANISM="Percolomonas cosmopolitus, Strain WS" /LENGTH=650 /DNA_ID=CAMNT_0005233735 /DNA_START=440 /DNA_END=2389 /DNA_ORIENTATION=-